MHKKILFLGLIISIVVNFNYVSGETGLIIPLKKPSLSDNEIKDKISKNILKPLKKPKKNESIKTNKMDLPPPRTWVRFGGVPAPIFFWRPP